MSNCNARDLLTWLGLSCDDEGISGIVEARELAARCRRRLWDVERNHDAGVDGYRDGNVINCGRRPDYLRERTEQLLKVAIFAGDALVGWA